MNYWLFTDTKHHMRQYCRWGDSFAQRDVQLDASIQKLVRGQRWASFYVVRGEWCNDEAAIERIATRLITVYEAPVYAKVQTVLDPWVVNIYDSPRLSPVPWAFKHTGSEIRAICLNMRPIIHMITNAGAYGAASKDTLYICHSDR
ncbi:MAG: hypothetical protein WCI67_08575 [Chloroflexales bacterium]